MMQMEALLFVVLSCFDWVIGEDCTKVMLSARRGQFRLSFVHSIEAVDHVPSE